MKRYIYCSNSTDNAVAFVNKVTEAVNQTQPASCPVTLVNNNGSHYYVYQHNCYCSAPWREGSINDIDLSKYIKTNDVDGAVAAVLDLIDNLVESNQLIYPEEVDSFLSQYKIYFDKISNIVSSVASKYDSDMSYDVFSLPDRFRVSAVKYLLNYDTIDFGDYYVHVSYALGLNAVNPKEFGIPEKYTDGSNEIKGPTGIYYKGNRVAPKLNQFSIDCAKLKVALEDYFESIKFALETGQDPFNYTAKSKQPGFFVPGEQDEAGAGKKNYKPARKNWTSIIEQLEADCEEGDPLYEQTNAGDYINSMCMEVEDKLGVWLEPSVQGGQGGIWIYENGTNETLAEDIDYASFNDAILDIAFDSKNMTQFKNAYRNYLKHLLEGE